MEAIWHFVIFCVIVVIAWNVILAVGGCALSAVCWVIALVLCAIQAVVGWIKEKWSSR